MPNGGFAPVALAERVKEQAQILDDAVTYLKPGGRLAYVTCSLLSEENEAQIEALLARGLGLEGEPVSLEGLSLRNVVRTKHGVQLSPLRSGTDGFYFATLRKVR